MEEVSWKIIDKYFTDNPSNLVAHHLDSYNKLVKEDIYKIFRENNPIRIKESGDDDNKNECLLYLGGKDGNRVYFGKPVIYDDNNTHYMYPNDARLRNMNYGVTIHYDVEYELTYYEENGDGEEKTTSSVLEKIYLGRMPIMLQSQLCILKNLPRETRYYMGECKNDYGGYFIIDGKEKVIVSQEKFADNMIYVKSNKPDELYSHYAEIRSVSEDTSKHIRKTSVSIVAPSSTLTNNQIVVNIPNVKKPIPLFILMRALGVMSDKEIIEYCLLDLEKNSNYIDLFIPSIHDANMIFNQQTALEFIATFTKRTTLSGVMDILMNYFLPHIGTTNFLDKAYFIGYMVNRMLRVFTKEDKPTDRDNFRFKRVELSGTLLYDLFREYFILQNKKIGTKIDSEFNLHKGRYKTDFLSLIETNYNDFFKERIWEQGIKRAFKGNWGSQANTKKVGVVQDLNRLSWNSFISQLRKFNLPLDASAKVVGPRLLHSSQWGYIDPADTPDGGNIGLHKHMSITTLITTGSSSKPMLEWLRAKTFLKLLPECSFKELYYFTKVFVNGNWIGSLENPLETIKLIKIYRRNGLIPCYISISFLYEMNELHIYTDAGRLTRPIYYVDKGKISFQRNDVKDLLFSDNFKWSDIVTGFNEKSISNFNLSNNNFYTISELYDQFKNGNELIEEELENKQAIIDYIDASEEECSLIASNLTNVKKNKYYTHVEIDPSLLFGVMGNLVIYPEDNPSTRNAFSCGQSKQAVSLYNTNYQMRIDKMSVVLNYGQVPLIKSKYLDYVNKEEMPYGVNTIVAIMSYTGYNVEDAILINAGSIKRGLFNTTYFTGYESYEETSKISGSTINSRFTQIHTLENVRGIKKGFDYTELDEHGIIKEDTPITEKTVLIGKTIYDNMDTEFISDSSVFTKKGQLGVVDKAFITEGEEGTRIAKIRIREERIPAIGDKMASRAGQKGTIGLIIPEEDMPYSADGTRPDLIINPHALPSRMTIGQLMETLFGKACAVYGGYGEGTAFAVKGPNTKIYGEMLVNAGFHSSGNQILYNGMTGEQLISSIYMGPTYYMRLKHMVKDKINARARGKLTGLTRQTVQGRANDGGLRIGEMERDGILAHGASNFLNESFMIRGDEYFMAVCNKSGGLAVYNPSQNIFLSPFADGPLQFYTGVDGNMNLENVSRFGRSFSIVRIPYSLKLLIQELQAMNIQMRIITEDNIDKLLGLSYSDNINKLLDESTNLDSLFSNYSRNMGKILSKNQEKKKINKNMVLSSSSSTSTTEDNNTIPSWVEEIKEKEEEKNKLEQQVIEISKELPYPWKAKISQQNNAIYYVQEDENGNRLSDPQWTYPTLIQELSSPYVVNSSSTKYNPVSDNSNSDTSIPYAPPSSDSIPYAPPSSDSIPYAPPSSDSIPYAPPSSDSIPYPPSFPVIIHNQELKNQYDSLSDVEKLKLMEIMAEKKREDEEKIVNEKNISSIPKEDDTISILKVDELPEEEKKNDEEESSKNQSGGTKAVTINI